MGASGWKRRANPRAKKFQSKNREYSCHSERSGAEGKISTPLKKRFFPTLRMKKIVF
jgi:hypothetical protein